MPKVLYPSLDPDGWVFSPMETADKLMADFFDANYSQTDIYLGNVSSFAYIVQITKGNVNECIKKLQETLTSYFLRYFSNVTVEVDSLDKENLSSKAEISIYMTFTDVDSQVYNLGKLIQMKNSRINKIVKLNNNGIIP